MSVGDVVHANVKTFGKNKFLMCISEDPPLYFSINSRKRAGYLEFSQSECSCLRNPVNFLSVGTLLSGDDLELDTLQTKGRMKQSLIQRIVDYVEEADVITDDDRDLVLPNLRKKYPK